MQPIRWDQALTRDLADLIRYASSGAALGSPTTGTGAVARLEAELYGLLGPAHRALALSNGTAALAAALTALPLNPGDEVITSGYDWGAATAAIRSAGAVPVYVDIDLASGLIDPDAIRASIGPRTAGIVVTHLFGATPDPEVIALADRHGLALVEDAAQALGGTWSGRPVGTVGTAAAVSFGPGKVVDAGEGGALIAADATILARACRATQHPNRQLLEGIDDLNPVFTNGRIHPLAAALAAVRITRLDRELQRRAETATSVLDRLQTAGIHHLQLSRYESSWNDVNVVLVDPDPQKIADAGLLAHRGPIPSPLVAGLPSAQERCATAFSLAVVTSC